MKSKHYISIAWCILWSLVMQAGDTLRMPSFEIAVKTWGNQKSIADSLQAISFRLQSITAALQMQSAVNIRSYGPSMLSSVSVRGGNANQTLLQWKGFNTNNAMLGQSDLSLIPMAFFENTHLLVGASKTRQAQGIAGNLELEEKVDSTTKQKVELATSVNSLRNQSSFLSYANHSKKNDFSLKLYHASGNNQFDYYPTFKKDVILLSDVNPSKLYSALVTNTIHLNRCLVADISAWLTQANRSIPVALNENNIHASQQDHDLKLSSSIRYKRNNRAAQLAYLFNPSQIDYRDANLQSSNQIRNHQVLLNHDYQLKRLVLQSSYLLNYAQGISSNYVGGHQAQAIQKISTGIITSMKKYLYVSSDVSANRLNDNRIVPTYSLKINKDASIFRNATAHVYTEFYRAIRFATLNDLYWNPGGNKNLQAEQSNNGSIGFSLESKKVVFGVQAFAKEINNMIVWIPTGTYWSPMNILAVRVNGIEVNSNYTMQVSSIRISAKLDYTYTAATITKEKSNTNLIGNQSPYIPYHKANASISLIRAKSFIQVQTCYVGYRFTSSDNKQFLNPYLIFNVQFGQHFNLLKKQLHVVLNIQNLFNENYQTIAYRPMPLRYAELCIQFRL